MIDRAVIDSVLGDLAELRVRRARQSRVLAALWYVCAFIAIAWHTGTRTLIDVVRTAMGRPRFTGSFRREVQHVVRSLRHVPWYAATVVGVIALGMALALTVFAVVDGVLFKPLPYPDARHLVTVTAGVTGLDSTAVMPVSPLDLDNWRAAAPDVPVTGFAVSPWVGLGQRVNETYVGVAQIERNFFDVVGVRPMVGGLRDEDFRQQPLIWSVVITDEFWHRRFGGAPDVVGQVVVGDAARGSGYRVTGIMPPGFIFPSSRWTVDLLTAYVPPPEAATDPRRRALTEVIARVPAGASLASLPARFDRGLAAAAALFPPRGPRPAKTSERRWKLDGPYDRVTLTPLTSTMGAHERPLFLGIFIAAIVLVALAALNASGLMAARCLDRARELTLRRALGAGALRLARLLSVEALLLIGAGTAAGLMLAVPLLHLALALLPEELVLLKPAAIDLRVAGFGLLSVVALAVPTTIWPLRRTLRAQALTSTDARASERTRSWGRFLVIASQVAGAVVLTVAGTLLVGSVLAVYAHTPPIRTDDVLAIETLMSGPGSGFNQLSPERQTRVMHVIDRLRAVPGVDAVAVTNAQLLKGGSWTSWFTPPAGAQPLFEVDLQGVTADYFRVVQPVLVAGRLPTEAELATGDHVLVVSERLAHAYWNDASPLGQTLIDAQQHVPFTVIGVVKDVRWWSWDQDVASAYGPYGSIAREPFPTFLLHVTGRRAEVVAAALRTLDDTDSLIRPIHATTLADLFADSVRGRRLQSWLFGSFAVAALIVVGTGVLGLMAMSMARRTREIGIRMALGSTGRGVLSMLVREQLSAVLAGMVAGALIAAWSVRFVKSNLYELTVYDVRVWAAALVAILVTALVGALIPAARASRVDPLRALRVE